MRLSTKIALAVSLGFSLVMGLATVALIYDELDFVERQMDLHGRLLGQVVATTARSTLASSGERQARELVREIDHHEESIAIRWIDLGAVEAESVRERLARGEIVGRVSPGDDDTLYTFVPLVTEDGAMEVIQIAESLGPRNAHVGLVLRRIIGGAAFGLVLVVVITYLLGRRLVDRPIGGLTRVARRVGAGDFSQRADESRGAELGALAREMNEMASNLERARDQALKHEAQLQHAARLATLGQLASGVAHEIGTPLQAITVRAELIAERAKNIDGIGDWTAGIQRQTQRVATIVRNLLRFARKQTPKRAPHDLAAIAERTIELVGTVERGNRIEIASRLDCDRCTAEIDDEQIEQVLTNLAINGIQAMPDGGRLTIGLERGAPEPPPDVEEPGEYVCVYVEDEGEGIPDDVMPHLFEPFFTTKDVDQGTGLGLSISYGIVREHGGWIDVTTRLGAGSRFSVYLPVGAPEC